MSTVNPSQSGELSDLILKWYEVQKHRSCNNNNNNEGQDIDVSYLTYILKALGFKLEFMDFQPESIKSDKSKEISVEVKCSVSGLVAKLNYKVNSCVCPKKKDEQTFWEVQCMAPSSKIQVKQEATSCSLLPEMSENCSLVSKAILNNLLKYYKNCVTEVEKGQSTESIKKIKIPEMFASSHDKQDVSAPIKTEALTMTPEINFATIPEINVTSEVQSTPIAIMDKNVSPSDSFIESINADKFNIATSSPNEKIDDQCNRDANVVQALNEARAKIDQALLFMKFNVTQDLSVASSTILMNSPQVKVGPKTLGTPGSMKRSVTANEITQHKASAQKAKQSLSRRSSFGIKPMTTVTPMMGTSALKRSNSMRYDTPRPRVPAAPKPSGIPSKTSSNMLTSNASSLSTSSSSIGSIQSKSVTKEPFLKALPGSKKKIVPKAPSLIERFKMQNTVTPKK